jgi:uncharacterized protein YjbI with pentapeptide repeats
MSEYTTRQILEMIEANGGPAGLNLSGKDLSEIDLSRETIQAELDRMHEKDPGAWPHWWHQGTEGINLEMACLESASLVDANLEEASLVGAHLKGANLRGAEMEEAILRGAELEGTDLRYANLKGANLRDAELEEAILESANLKRANLRDAELEEAILWKTNLEEANLWCANLKEASLRGAELEEAILMGANLEGADLRGAKLARVDLQDTWSIKGIFLHRALLDHTQLTKEQLGEAIGEELENKWIEAKEAYLALKNNFEQIGRYNDASWAYRRERRMEKRASWQKAKKAFRERHWGETFDNGRKVVKDCGIEFVCDYGEGIGEVLRALVILWVVFAIFYGAIAGVWGPWQETSSGKIRYATRNPLHLLAFSLGAMTTLQPAGLAARPTKWMQAAVPFQALIGIILAGLLGFVLGNRIRRS